VLPEVYLEDADVQGRIQAIQDSMRSYLERGLFETHENLIYVERQAGGRTRRGIILALDLERYDFHKGAASLIRATEGTILERLPPRMKIRQGAPLELPHILVLIDDPQRTVIEPLAAQAERLSPLYDFELMLGSGHLRGFAIQDPTLEAGVIRALEALADGQAFARRYDLPPGASVMLFAMGDGNHSLATAKAIWEQIKAQAGPRHPARYALVEIENIHDPGLEFEPIHRILFGVRQELAAAMQAYFGGRLVFIPCESEAAMIEGVESSTSAVQRIGMVTAAGFRLAELHQPPSNLPVGSLQAFLDEFLQAGGAEKVDYVHGEDVVARLGAQPGNAGFYLPAMDKHELFRTVLVDGALPRKTFSMGEARDKRFYMECRKIA
jgi:hypothetical protein